MSERQVIALLRFELADANFGFPKTVPDVIAAEGIAAGVVTVVYNFVRWLRSGNLTEASAGHEIAIVPLESTESLEIPGETQRDGVISLELSFTTYSADPLTIEENVFVHAAALRRCLDRLREFSDANGGTVLQVREPVTITFAPAPGTATSAGFRARFTIEERSAV
jgi:hypothetical protein